MKRHAVWYEIPSFYLCLCAFNFLLAPENPGFVGVSPHPYWLGILLFAFRYGLFAGLVSGILSTTLYFAAIWFFGSRYVFQDEIDLSFYILPSLFVVIGTTMGGGVQRQLSQIKKLRKDLQLADEGNANLGKNIDSLKLINAELEKRVATNMTTVVTLYQGAQKLESTDKEAIYPAIVEFFSKTIGATKASLYLEDSINEGWRMHCSYGWASETEWPIFVKFHEGILGQAAESGRIFSLKDYWGKDLSKLNFDSEGTNNFDISNHCVLTVPLRLQKNGKVIGLYVVHTIPLLNLNSATLNLLTFLSQWANQSLSRAARFEDLEDQEILDRRLGVYSFNFFKTRLEEEFTKSATYYLPLTIGFLHVETKTQVNTEQKELLLLSLAEALKHSTRPIDIVAKNTDPTVPFCCLFSTLKEEQVRESIIPKFNQILENLNLTASIQVHFKLSSFSPKTKSHEELIERAIA